MRSSTGATRSRGQTLPGVRPAHRFRECGVPQVFFCDDGAFLAETLGGLQMAFDACWVAARVAGLGVRAKEEAKTRRGTKTAWMECYYDEPWRRTVIYNYLTGRPITFFDFDGGLRRKDAITAATHFDFLLTDWDFKLNRTTGELRLDPQGFEAVWR